MGTHPWKRLIGQNVQSYLCVTYLIPIKLIWTMKHSMSMHVVRVLFFKKSNNTRHNNQMVANQKHFYSSKKTNKQIMMTRRVLFVPWLFAFNTCIILQVPVMRFAQSNFQSMIGLSAFRQSIWPIALHSNQVVQRNEFSNNWSKHLIVSIYARTIHMTYIAC